MDHLHQKPMKRSHPRRLSTIRTYIDILRVQLNCCRQSRSEIVVDKLRMDSTKQGRIVKPLRRLITLHFFIITSLLLTSLSYYLPTLVKVTNPALVSDNVAVQLPNLVKAVLWFVISCIYSMLELIDFGNTSIRSIATLMHVGFLVLLFLIDHGASIYEHGLYNLVVFVLISLPIVLLGRLTLGLIRRMRENPAFAKKTISIVTIVLLVFYISSSLTGFPLNIWQRTWVTGSIAGPMETKRFLGWVPRSLLRGKQSDANDRLQEASKSKLLPPNSNMDALCEWNALEDIRFPLMDVQNLVPGLMNRWAGPWWVPGLKHHNVHFGTDLYPSELEKRGLIRNSEDNLGDQLSVRKHELTYLEDRFKALNTDDDGSVNYVRNGFGVRILYPITVEDVAYRLRLPADQRPSNTNTCSKDAVDLNAYSAAFGFDANPSSEELMSRIKEQPNSEDARLTEEVKSFSSWFPENKLDEWHVSILATHDGTEQLSLDAEHSGNIGDMNALSGLWSHSHLPLEIFSLPVIMRIACPAYEYLSISLFPDTRSEPFNTRVKNTPDSLGSGVIVDAGLIARTKIIPPRSNKDHSVVDVLLPSWVHAESLVIRCGPTAGESPEQQVLMDQSQRGWFSPADGTDRKYISLVRPQFAQIKRQLDIWTPPEEKTKEKGNIKKESNTSLHSKKTAPNVLVIFIDAVSRLHFQRKLPKLLAYMKDLQDRKKMDAYENLRYHASGHTTGFSTVPMYTGWDQSTLHTLPHFNDWYHSKERQSMPVPTQGVPLTRLYSSLLRAQEENRLSSEQAAKLKEIEELMKLPSGPNDDFLLGSIKSGPKSFSNLYTLDDLKKPDNEQSRQNTGAEGKNLRSLKWNVTSASIGEDVPSKGEKKSPPIFDLPSGNDKSPVVPIWRHFNRGLGYVTASSSNDCEDWSSAFASFVDTADHRQNNLYCSSAYHPRPTPYGLLNGPYSIRSRALGSVHAHVPMLEFAASLWKTYPSSTPKFAHLTLMEGHEGTGEVVNDLDSDLVDLLKFILEDQNGYKDTVVQVVSDHGLHMGLGNLFFTQGQLEWLMPGLFYLLPLESNLPMITSAAREDMRINQNRLVSATDAYLTLRNILEASQIATTLLDPNFPKRLYFSNTHCSLQFMDARRARYYDSVIDFYSPFRAAITSLVLHNLKEDVKSSGLNNLLEVLREPWAVGAPSSSPVGSGRGEGEEILERRREVFHFLEGFHNLDERTKKQFFKAMAPLGKLYLGDALFPRQLESTDGGNDGNDVQFGFVKEKPLLEGVSVFTALHNVFEKYSPSKDPLAVLAYFTNPTNINNGKNPFDDAEVMNFLGFSDFVELPDLRRPHVLARPEASHPIVKRPYSLFEIVPPDQDCFTAGMHWGACACITP